MYIEKWYEKSWVIVLLLIFVFPVGAYLMWTEKYDWEEDKKKKITIIGSIIVVLIIILIVSTGKGTEKQPAKVTKNDTTTSKVETKKELTIYRFSANPDSGVVGAPITFYFSTTGEGKLEYKLCYTKDSKDTTVQEYSTNKDIAWIPTEPGTYGFYLVAKNEDGEVKSDKVIVKVISKEEKDSQIAAEAEKAKTKAEEEAKAKAAKEAAEAIAYDTGITFENLARNPLDYKMKKVKFTGKIIQVITGTSSNQYRFAVDSDYDQVILLEIPSNLLKTGNILEDDIITIKGVSQGTIDYKSALGGKITVPAVTVDSFQLN